MESNSTGLSALSYPFWSPIAFVFQSVYNTSRQYEQLLLLYVECRSDGRNSVQWSDGWYAVLRRRNNARSILLWWRDSKWYYTGHESGNPTASPHLLCLGCRCLVPAFSDATFLKNRRTPATGEGGWFCTVNDLIINIDQMKEYVFLYFVQICYRLQRFVRSWMFSLPLNILTQYHPMPPSEWSPWLEDESTIYHMSKDAFFWFPFIPWI